MKRRAIVAISLCSVSLCALSFAAPALAQDAEASVDGEIIVTAQKRAESINNVGMSITAVPGDLLVQRGVVSIADLPKLVPGLNYNTTAYGTPVYTIRGVGFQENSLGASPTVSTYVDEVPIPFPLETLGATLDLERVEVLKGPQGTLYGQNSTGGAINFIAARPTDHLAFGADARYGRFNSVDLNGFVSGPLTDTLKVRVAAKLIRSDAWQQSYSRSDSLGRMNQLVGRVLVDWEPTSRLTVSLNLNGWRDRSETQAPQHVGTFVGGSPGFEFAPFYAFPFAPRSARAADWDPGFSFRQNNRFWQATGRVNYALSDDLTLTSISSYERYDRDMPVDQDGTPFEDFRNYLGGSVKTFFQEVRLNGKLGGRGTWIIGGNYEKDKVNDTSLLFNGQSTQSFLGGTSRNVGAQPIRTLAGYANIDYEIVDNLTAQGGVRFTDMHRTFRSCTRDAGDGRAVASGFFPGAVAGGCLTLLSSGGFGEVNKTLNEDNVSWRGGLNYKFAPGKLVYANVSKGYKSGSFPLLGLAFEPQANPVVQESVLAYEAGVKLSFGRALQLNAAGFYYDYKNKQTRGVGLFPIFGNLETLFNIPKSRITGFEVDAVVRPVEGLTVSPSVTLVSSKILGSFVNRTTSGVVGDFAGEPFPYTPKWMGNTDVDYRRPVGDGLIGFVGGNVEYRSSANGSFGQLPLFRIAPRAVVDMRAGVETDGGKLKVWVWGNNVFNKFYWITVTRISDSFVNWTGRPATYGAAISYRY